MGGRSSPRYFFGRRFRSEGGFATLPRSRTKSWRFGIGISWPWGVHWVRVCFAKLRSFFGINTKVTRVSGQFDHELKFGRALKHLQDLDAKSRDWFAGDHQSIREKLEADGRTVWLATAEQVPPDPFSLLIGDCLHNLRSGLDVLAFSLALAYTTPLPDDLVESSEFPIFGDEDRRGRTGVGAQMFRDNGRFKVRGIDPNALTEIERLQPYYRGYQFRTHPLWVLHDLDRI